MTVSSVTDKNLINKTQDQNQLVTDQSMISQSHKHEFTMIIFLF